MPQSDSSIRLWSANAGIQNVARCSERVTANARPRWVRDVARRKSSRDQSQSRALSAKTRCTNNQANDDRISILAPSRSSNRSA